MRSRIVAISLCVLLFLSAVYIVGFPEQNPAADSIVTTETTVITTEPSSAPVTSTEASSVPVTSTEPTTEKVETVTCSFKDVSYGNDPNQSFDLTLPVDNREETGLILFLHGGGWVSGDKKTLKGTFDALAKNNDHAVASLNYRYAVLGETDVYNIIDDITAALDRIKNLAAGYSVNINKVVICGHSAGGHLALLYSYRFCDVSPVKPVGVIATAPAADLSIDGFYKNNSLGDEKYMCELMSNVIGVKFTPETRAAQKELLMQVSPIAYVTKNTVPTIIAHGRKDKVVPFEGTERLIEVLNQNNVENEFLIFDNSGHQLDKEKDKDTKVIAEELLREKIDSWFKS